MAKPAFERSSSGSTRGECIIGDILAGEGVLGAMVWPLCGVGGVGIGVSKYFLESRVPGHCQVGKAHPSCLDQLLGKVSLVRPQGSRGDVCHRIERQVEGARLKFHHKHPATREGSVYGCVSQA